MHTIYFYDRKLFGIRSKEHRDIRYSNFRVDSTSITFDESSSKTYHGGLKDLKYTPRVVNHICCPSEKAKNYPWLVSCYEKYLECIKPLSEKIDAFYFRPNRDKFCYEYAPVGINSLNKILPDELCKGAGLTRKTSHNLIVSCATALFQNSVEEKLIRERTGHRSNAVFKYEKASLEQQRKVGDILGPPAGLHVNEMASDDAKESDFLLDDFDFDILDDILRNIPIPGDRPTGSDSNTVSESFSRSVFNNCTINFVSK